MARAPRGKTNRVVVLDTEMYGPDAKEFISYVESRLVGQPRIIKTYADIIEIISSGFWKKEGTIANVLLVGPSGTGKTESVKMLSEFLFHTQNGALRLDGSNYSERYDVSNIKGSPMGYIGWDEDPDITQEKLDRPAFNFLCDRFMEQLEDKDRHALEQLWEKHHELFVKMEHLLALERNGFNQRKDIEKLEKEIYELERRVYEDFGFPQYNAHAGSYISIFHVDEIEQAHKLFYNILYRIMDEGILKISRKDARAVSPDSVSFRSTINIFTSNIGAEEIKKELQVMQGKSVRTGFHSLENATMGEIDKRVYEISRKWLERHFSTPFLNRIDYIIAARPLDRQAIEIIFEKKLRDLSVDLLKWEIPVALEVDDKVKELIVDESMDRPEEGARPLGRKFWHYIVRPFAIFKNTGQIKPGDVIHLVVRKNSHAKGYIEFRNVTKFRPKKKIITLSS